MKGQDAEPFYLGYTLAFSVICHVYMAKLDVGE